MKNIPIFLALVLLLPAGIRGDINVTEKGTASHSSFENILNKTEDSTFTTTTVALTEDESRKVNKQRKVDEKQNKDIISESLNENKNVSHRIERESNSVTPGMECISCFSKSTSSLGDSCYSGRSTKTQKCADVEHCFTELHPQYIKRGCTLPSSINRTFACKCPLCNDKPEDEIYYNYMTIGDWEYDNHRLEEPVVGIDLLCRVCDTKGFNEESDMKCRQGITADYIQCGHNQLCYTNMDHQIDFVSRGCINKPAFNAMYNFCNESKCNNAYFLNPRKKRSYFTFKTIPAIRTVSSANQEALTTFVLIVTVLFQNRLNMTAKFI